MFVCVCVCGMRSCVCLDMWLFVWLLMSVYVCVVLFCFVSWCLVVAWVSDCLCVCGFGCLFDCACFVVSLRMHIVACV